MAEAGYPAAREYAAEEEHNYSATSFCCPSGQLPGLFCSKVTGAPPFHDVNVTQLIVIVIDYYYHTVIMLSCTCTLIKERENRRLAEQPIRSSSSMAAIRFCSAMYSRMRFLSGWPAWSRISPSFTGDFPAHFIPPCSSGRFDHVMGKHIAALELLTSCLSFGHGTGYYAAVPRSGA